MSGKHQLINSGKSYLKGDLNDSATSFDVSDGDRFPSADFYIAINNEIMLVTDVTDETLTVVRGQGGTTAATHIDGDVVAAPLTVDGLQRYIQDSTPMFANRPCCKTNRLGVMEDASGNSLALGNFTWVNQGTATASQNAAGGIYMSVPKYAGDNCRMLVKSITAPIKITSCVRWGTGTDSATSISLGTKVGLCFRESSTGKIVAKAWRGNRNMTVSSFDSPTATNSNINYASWRVNGPVWFQLEYDGSNLYFRRSIDGVNFMQQYTQADDAFFTTAPDQAGLFVNDAHNHADTQAQFMSWIEE